MTIEIVDFTIKNGGSFHSYVDVYHGKIPKKSDETMGCHGMPWDAIFCDAQHPST